MFEINAVKQNKENQRAEKITKVDSKSLLKFCRLLENNCVKENLRPTQLFSAQLMFVSGTMPDI